MPTKRITLKKSKKKLLKPEFQEKIAVKGEKDMADNVAITEGPVEVEEGSAANPVFVSDDIKDEKGDRTEKYYEAVGRRKESTARVRVLTKKSTDALPSNTRGIITVNDKPYFEYFRSEPLQDLVDAPLKKLKSLNRFKATIKVNGGGLHGQADAIKFGLSRALVLFDPNFAKKLRKAGYLTRDSREKERRKYGLKKARKSPQWAKR